MCKYFENYKELPSYKWLSLAKKNKTKKNHHCSREIHQLYGINTDSFLYINVTLWLNIIICYEIML